jgi:PKHD-type hydroxylase
MLIQIPRLLTPEQLALCQDKLATADWRDGRATAGPLAARAKQNLQLDESSEMARTLGGMIVGALEQNPLFLSAALPKQVFPPLFNRYEPGMRFGTHIDNAIRQHRGSRQRLRTDLSATLFLSPPDSYDGGELIVEDSYGAHRVKLPAGDMILYPASSLHHVAQITRGARVAAFFWVQSLVKDDGERTLLFDLDNAIRDLGQTAPDAPSLVRLTGCYHNLLRRWAEI